MAAALLMLYPGHLSAAVLLRPLSPFAVDPNSRIPGTRALIIDGDQDERRLPRDGASLAKRLVRMGADVSHHLLPTGYAVTEDALGARMAQIAALTTALRHLAPLPVL